MAKAKSQKSLDSWTKKIGELSQVKTRHKARKQLVNVTCQKKLEKRLLMKNTQDRQLKKELQSEKENSIVNNLMM